jgi:PAS domain S-box-containing protein
VSALRVSLQSRLTLAFLGLAVLPLLALAALLGAYAYHTYVDTALAHQREVAARVGRETVHLLEGLRRSLARAQEFRELPGLPRERQRWVLEEVAADRELFREVALLDPDGREVVRVSNLSPILPEDLRERADDLAFSTALVGGEDYYGPMRFDDHCGEPVLTLAVPVHDRRSGEVGAVLVAEVRLTRLWDLYAGLRLGEDAVAYLLDGAGQVIAHPDPSVVLRGTRFTPGTRAGIGTSLEGGKAILAVQGLDAGPRGLRVVVERPLAAALASALWPLGLVGLAVAGALLVALGLVFTMRRRVIGPILALTRAARAIHTGDLDHRAALVQGDELGELAGIFNAMTARLQDSLGELQAEVQERREAERALRRNNALLNAVVEGAADAVYVKDLEGRYRLINSAGARMVGLAKDQILGRTDVALFSPETAQAIMASDRRIMAAGETRTFEERAEAAGVARVFLATKGPWRDGDGHTIGLVGLSRDITERIRAEAEIRRLNEELERRVAQRTAELTQANRELEAFAYSVSHDLRAPLRAINGFSQALVEDYGEGLAPQARDYLGRLQAGTRTMGELIDGLLRLSRFTRGELERQRVDLGALACEVAAELREAEPGRVVDLDVQPGLLAEGDPRLLRTALENLLGNAWKYTAERDRAIVSVGAQERGGVRVYHVRDNGVGFDMDYADALFKPFQRLHPAREFPGIGIGLATVQRIVQRHGGTIWAESAPDAGATFYFTLEGGMAAWPSAPDA